MNADLYVGHFGFRERPFALSPDPGFLFWTREHKRAFSILEYGLMTAAPLTVVTGEVGTGKTTLIQAILSKADPNLVIGLISNAQGNRDDLLRWVLNSLDIEHPVGSNYVALFQAFQDFVIDCYSAGRRVVLFIDEAQNLGMDTLEELRMLTNVNSGKDELLQLILVGQPELRTMIERPELRQFAQRVSAAYHIDPFGKSVTRDYIAHRLKAAGGTGEEVSEAACDLIFSYSDGIPRIINKIADLALVYAASENKHVVDADVVKELIEDGIILQAAKGPFFLTNRSDMHPKAAE